MYTRGFAERRGGGHRAAHVSWTPWERPIQSATMSAVMPAYQHASFMRRALQLALRGQGFVEPNPMVGAVIVRDGLAVAEGWHRRFGGPHAEIEAIGKAREKQIPLSGCDMYVTLEPCCHHGKTPPCTEALIKAGVSRVNVAMADPYSEVAGQGMARLREAGIRVDVGLCEDEARQLNEPYLKKLATGLPWVIAKWAQTLDGRIATSTNDSRWISNEQSRKAAHKLRGRVDVVMVGIGTVLADDPQLTVRLARARRKARLVVIDPDLRSPTDAKLLQAGTMVTIATRQSLIDSRSDEVGKMESQGVEFFGLPERGPNRGAVPLQPLFEHLAAECDVTNVMVEGGASLFGSLFDQGMIDQVVAFVGPKVLGDKAALSAVNGLSCELMEHTKRLALQGVKRFGEDVMLDYRVHD